jgi:HPr(Ser) kinase/phosphatase
MNYRLNQMGINTAKEFTTKLADEIKRKNMNNGVE